MDEEKEKMKTGRKVVIALIIILIKAVLITAPLGALGMDLTYQKCLKREGNI